LFKKNIWIILAILLLIADQIIKVSIVNSSIDIDLWGDFLNIAQSKNYGIFTGFPLNYSEIVIIFILALFGFLFIRNKKFIPLFPYFLIALTGVISNLIDKVRLGFVIDYINVFNFSHFNIADLLIYIGCIMIIFRIIMNNKSQDTNNKKVCNLEN